MSPVLDVCNLLCEWCWRNLSRTSIKFEYNTDKPKDIVDGCIEAQKEILQGFWGNPNINKKRLKEAMEPLHFAISLTSEPTFYPKLPQLIDEIHGRNMTSFLVTNGTNPDTLKKLLSHQPTQTYITLPAPNKDIFLKVCKPLIKDGWEKIQESLHLLSQFNRSTMRLTLTKGLNNSRIRDYSTLIKKAQPDFVEVKSYSWVGSSRHRLKEENVFPHNEILEFAGRLAKESGLQVVDQKKESRVALLMYRDSKKRFLFP